MYLTTENIMSGKTEFIAASIRQVEEVYLRITLPRNFWHLIPEWVQKPEFANTKVSQRQMAARSEELFSESYVSISKVPSDLVAAGMVPTRAFYLSRDTGNRRVRLTFGWQGESLSEEQMESLEPLMYNNIYDVMGHRTGPTLHLPEHISVDAGIPDRAPGGGSYLVRVVDDEVVCRLAINEVEQRLHQQAIRASLAEL